MDLASQRFMKERPVLPLVISMALPMTLSMLVSALYNIVDSYFVASMSEAAMTALSLVYPLQNLVVAVLVGFGVGTNAMIAYYLGARDGENAERCASLGLALSTLHGVLLTAFCLFITPHFLALFTADETTLSLGTQYANVVFWFTIPNAVAIAYEKTFQAVGRMKVSMLCMGLGCVVNILLDPLMIFGLGPFPAMGMRGAALATGIGQTAALAAYLLIDRVKPLAVRVRIRSMAPRRELCKKLYGIGIPSTLSMALPSVQISALNAILSGFGAGYVLVLGAYFKLQSFLYMTANGVVQGMRPLVAYNHGAGESGRVKKILGAALGIIALVMAVGTVLCLAVPGALIGLFTENSETIALGRGALRIICLGFLVSAVSLAVSGAFEGLGRGDRSLVISVLRYIVPLLPLAWALSRALGATGVFHAFWITELLGAAVSWLLWRRQELHLAFAASGADGETGG